MDGPISGDIFPAKQAIELIDQIDLSLPIEIPPVPPEAEPDNLAPEEQRELLEEIARLKIEKNAYDADLATRARLPIERKLSII